MLSTDHNKKSSLGLQYQNFGRILLIFILISGAAYVLDSPLKAFLEKYAAFTYFPEHTTLKSEYTIGEQLSKYYLLLTILLSVFVYPKLRISNLLLLSIAYLILGLIMYMSESNMVTEEAQPILGILILGSIGFLLFRERLWASLLSIGVAVFFLSLGSLTDLIHERADFFSNLPQALANFFESPPEELFDVTGIGFICMSAVFCFHVQLIEFVGQNRIGFVLMLFSSGLIAMGNSFLHYGYTPSENFHAFALIVTIIGFLAFFATDRFYFGLSLVSPELLYAFLVGFFLILPSIFGRPRANVDFLLWVPVAGALAVFLWKKHDINQT